MTEQCDHDCANCQAAENCEEKKIEKLKPNELSSFKKTIAVISGKGGVGKSLITSLLAVAMKKAGKKVGIMDADVTGASIPQGFGINSMMAAGDEGHIYPVRSPGGIPIISANLLLADPADPIIWRGPLLSSLVQQLYSEVAYGDLDCLLIDCPPGTGDVPLTIFQMIPVDGIIVVTSPQDLVKLVVSKAITMAQMMNVPILGLVTNNAYVECPACQKKIEIYGSCLKVREEARKHGLEVLLELPIEPKLAQAIDEGRIEDVDVSLLDELLKKIF